MNPTSAETVSQESQGIVQRCFVEQTGDATIYFQIIDLGKQLYVWISAGGVKMPDLYLGIKTPLDQVPSVATIIPGHATSGSLSLARRLALKLNKPVLCSCNFPPNVPLLQAVAERRLLQELADMKQINEPAAPQQESICA